MEVPQASIVVVLVGCGEHRLGEGRRSGGAMDRLPLRRILDPPHSGQAGAEILSMLLLNDLLLPI